MCRDATDVSEAYAAFAGSISPRIMVASLLPVKTATQSAITPTSIDKGNTLMGSFGWKSTEVTVPLCPGSYARHDEISLS